MKHSSFAREQFEKVYENCCIAAAELYGDWPHDGKFIAVPDKTETEVRDTIAEQVDKKMNSNDVERYLYVTTFNDVTFIKR